VTDALTKRTVLSSSIGLRRATGDDLPAIVGLLLDTRSPALAKQQQSGTESTGSHRQLWKLRQPAAAAFHQMSHNGNPGFRTLGATEAEFGGQPS
jgi:hypothetical protein